MPLSLVSWNINGLRSFGDREQWWRTVAQFDADLVCMQEIKVARDSVRPWMASVAGQYSSCFALTDVAYSGVASFAREPAWAAEVCLLRGTGEIFPAGNLDEDELEMTFRAKWSAALASNTPQPDWRDVDAEGRCVVSKHRIQLKSPRWLYIFNVYCPRNDRTRPKRQMVQLMFYHLLQQRALPLLRDPDNHVMIVGDLNTAHQPIDVFDDQQFDYAKSHSRLWLSELLQLRSGRRLLDAFRHLNGPVPHQYTCWNSQLGGRQTNYGSRIDYIVVDDELAAYLVECRHLTEVAGSDHCPVLVRFNEELRLVPPPNTVQSRQWAAAAEQAPTAGQSSIRSFLCEPSGTPATRAPPCSRKQSVQTKMSSFITATKRLKREPEQQVVLEQDAGADQALQWRRLFESKAAPLCSGHQLPCARRKVTKPGPNHGREFYCCPKLAAMPAGHPETRCNFFRWLK